MVALNEAYFLQDLAPRQLQKVERIVRSRAVRAGSVLVAVGSEVHSLAVVASGAVRVVVPVDRGDRIEEEVLSRLGPGECFGEFSFADRKLASASVVADEETTLYEMTYEALDALLASDPDVALKVLGAMFRMVVGRLRSTDADLAMARYVIRYV